MLKVPKHGQELYFFSIQDIYVMLCLWCFSIQLIKLKPHTSTRVSVFVRFNQIYLYRAVLLLIPNRFNTARLSNILLLFYLITIFNV